MPPGEADREARLAEAGIVPYWHVPPSCPECDGDVDRDDAWWCERCERLLCARPGCADGHVTTCYTRLAEEDHALG